MKRQVKIATLLVAGMTLLAACSNDGFKTTDGGLHYRFDKMNKDGQQVQEGDVLVGEMTFKFDTMTLFTNVGKADRIMQASPNFPGNLHEGLLLMHVGDQATFAIEADTLAKFMQPDQMPPTYQRGTGQKFYYEINLQDIVTKEELEEEREAFMAEAQQRQENEPQMIADYVRDNGIAAKPNADGLYVIVKKRGNGPKVATGKEVAVNWRATPRKATSTTPSAPTNPSPTPRAAASSSPAGSRVSRVSPKAASCSSSSPPPSATAPVAPASSSPPSRPWCSTLKS